MKKFSFPLGRVLDWRRTEARIEENNLERLYAELRVLEDRARIVAKERQDAAAAVAGATRIEGWQLAQLDQFQRAAGAEQRRLTAHAADCRERIAAQRLAVAAKRRQAKPLEKLRERRLEEWKTGLNREIERQAQESFLARWPNR